MNLIRKLLQRYKLFEKGMYSVEYGDKAGCFIVYIKEENMLSAHAFLVMPYPLEALFFTEQDLKDHLRDGSLKLVEILPDNVYEVCKGNFRYLKKKEGV
jgi:hypothetical protein